jgi:integrase
VFSELKTSNARRRIPLPQEVLRELKLWKLRYPYSEQGLVFPSPNGSPLDHSNFHRRVWDPLLQAAKLPHGRFHALRHSFASALITDNQSPKLVQTMAAWIGHARLTSEDSLFPSRVRGSPHLSTRQYARIVDSWVNQLGLDRASYGTHTLRRTKATLIYRRTKNLRAVQLLLGHTKLDYLPSRTMSRCGQLS